MLIQWRASSQRLVSRSSPSSGRDGLFAFASRALGVVLLTFPTFSYSISNREPGRQGQTDSSARAGFAFDFDVSAVGAADVDNYRREVVCDVTPERNTGSFRLDTE